MPGDSKLLVEFDRLVEAIDEATINPTWALADWLVANVPNEGRGKPAVNASRDAFTLAQLAERSNLGRQYLQALRLTATRFPPGTRVDGVSCRAHAAAWSKHGSVDGAVGALKVGGKLRDVSGPMESPDAMHENLRKMAPEQQAAFIVEHAEDAEPEVLVAIADALAGTDVGAVISATHDLVEAAKTQQIEHETGKSVKDEMDRDAFYVGIGSRVFDIVTQVRRIVRAIRKFDAQHDEDELALAVERLEGAEHMIRQAREALAEAEAIDMDDLMADINVYLKEAK
jgi:hypothetical protein